MSCSCLNLDSFCYVYICVHEGIRLLRLISMLKLRDVAPGPFCKAGPESFTLVFLQSIMKFHGCSRALKKIYLQQNKRFGLVFNPCCQFHRFGTFGEQFVMVKNSDRKINQKSCLPQRHRQYIRTHRVLGLRLDNKYSS